jgi:hypothetical protein
MYKITAMLPTAGDGYWSNKSKTVRVTGLAVTYENDEGDFGELCAYFDTKTWSVKRDGLIYTDSQFLDDLRATLASMGLAAGDVDYSEQGMQGDDYVSLDVGEKFLKSWHKVVDKVAA